MSQSRTATDVSPSNVESNSWERTSQIRWWRAVKGSAVDVDSGALLRHLVDRTPGRLLVGTWAAAGWAIRFYQRHGFRLVPQAETDRLLSGYWTIPTRQREVSVVLDYPR